MNDRNFTIAITGAVIGYVIIQLIVERYQQAKELNDQIMRRLEFFRADRERLISEENTDGS